MAATPGMAPDYYVWHPPGSRISIQLRLDVVDRMLPGIMAGLGAVPRRGAEVGGVLLGVVEEGETTVVRVQGFEAVPCSYKRGPSYLLSENDLPEFESAVRANGAPDAELRPVGYYRSHTRDAQALGEDDLALCERFFPPPNGVVLLVRPFATKASVAGFVTYEDGKLGPWPRKEFPFRRADLEGGDAPRRSPLSETPRRTDGGSWGSGVREPGHAAHGPAHAVPLGFSFGGYATTADRPAHETATPEAAAGLHKRLGWVWIPLSFLFLVLGMALGFFAARTVYPLSPELDGNPFSLALSAERSEDNLLIRWDRTAPAIRNARRGALRITDGPFTKDVELSASELQTGTVIFHNTTKRVSIRMDVFVRDRSSVADVTEWKQ